MNIKSSTSLRNNYNDISALARETQEPIYITKNGEGDLVVMSIPAFERRDEIVRLRTKLEMAEASRLDGDPTYTIEQSRNSLENIYGQGK